MKSIKGIQQKNAFGLAAKDYQKYRRSYGAELYMLLFSLIEGQKAGEKTAILDIGCGTGKSTEPIFASADGRDLAVLGIDPDEAMLNEARLSAKKKKLPIVYMQGTAEKLPFEKESFDAAISGAAFHWFGNKRSLAKILNILKPGGVLFVFWVQYAESATSKPTIGEEIYERYDWKGIPKKFRGQDYVCGLLNESGFKNVEKKTILFKERATVAESVGLLKTNSSYLLLSEKDKKDFVRDMTKAYKDALGKAGYEESDMELRVCYGFK
ncbi:MAG TPA: class I SAM-dependent methyltransferase [Candidatus Paceibacterota bacterium]